MKKPHPFSNYSDEVMLQQRARARRVYKPFTLIYPTWHPVFIEECNLMNAEVGALGLPISEVCHV